MQAHNAFPILKNGQSKISKTARQKSSNRDRQKYSKNAVPCPVPLPGLGGIENLLEARNQTFLINLIIVSALKKINCSKVFIIFIQEITRHCGILVHSLLNSSAIRRLQFLRLLDHKIASLIQIISEVSFENGLRLLKRSIVSNFLTKTRSYPVSSRRRQENRIVVPYTISIRLDGV